MIVRLQEFFLKKPNGWDVLSMVFFAVFITNQAVRIARRLRIISRHAERSGRI